MINSLKELFDKQDIDENSDLRKNAEFFNRNGYCVILKSDLDVKKITEIIDLLLEKESWRGGWEGKEEYMKHGKNFQPGAHRLGNLFNKHELFRELLINEDILKTSLAILGDDVKIGGLDMRDKTDNVVVMIFLDDADESNGRLRVVPKTHKIKGWIDENTKDKTKHTDEIFLDVKKSGMIFMDANLWHSGTTNNTGKRRRVLFMDIRRRNIPQLLNQRIYLDEITQKKLTDIQKYLLGVGDDDPVFDDRVFTAGNVYRKEFKTDVFVKLQD